MEAYLYSHGYTHNMLSSYWMQWMYTKMMSMCLIEWRNSKGTGGSERGTYLTVQLTGRYYDKHSIDKCHERYTWMMNGFHDWSDSFLKFIVHVPTQGSDFCECAYDGWGCRSVRNEHHISCTDKASPQCVCESAWWGWSYQQIPCCTRCTCKGGRQSGCACASSRSCSERILGYILGTWMASHHCVSEGEQWG